jgi:LemA protein
MISPLWILLGAAALWFVAVYNRLVRVRMRAYEAWSDIEVQLKRRYNLIPNLVETVKGYASHEEGVFEAVTKARAMAIGAEGIKEQAKAENMLQDALKSLFAVAEAYPQLRAVESFIGLQNELTDTEDKIQAARRFYNGNVRDLNIAIQTFPTNLIAGMLGFKEMDFFELGEGEEAAKEPVAVDFSKDK